MNAARLSRKWADAGGDPGLMAEALADEIDDPASGLVSRDHLDMRLAELRGEMDRRFTELRGEMELRFAELRGEMDRRFAELEAKVERRLAEQGMMLTWRMLGIAAGQLIMIGAMIKLLG
jgi:uncharacterized small protein (DUF1192 family)